MASIQLQGDNSGSLTIQAPSDAGNHTLTLPATTHTLATQNALGVRNLIINGDMRIAQRGTSATGISTAAYKTVDRFKMTAGAGTSVWSMTQDTDVPSGQGFANSVRLNCTTAEATVVDHIHLMQIIEAQNCQHLKYGTSNAEQLTLSFWVKSNKTGTYVAWFYQVDDVRQTNKTYTIDAANTWEKKTITISSDTIGVIDNDNDQGLMVRWILGAASALTSGTSPDGTWEAYTDANAYAGQTVNLADSTSNYINITGVQLEVGDTATPFEHRPYDMELERCKRYYEKMTAPNSYTRFAVGQCVATTQSKTLLYFTEKRAVPSIAFATTSLFMVGANTGGGLLCTAITSEQPSYKTVGIVANVSSGLSTGDATYLAANNSTSAYIEISSEL